MKSRCKFLLPLFLNLMICLHLPAQYNQLIPVADYGWLDQYSMDSRHNFVGNEACVPTSSVNAMTYLQNSSPSIFGSTLSGSTYPAWEDTDDAFISIMGTTAGNGTYYAQFVWTLNMYVALTKQFPQVQFSGMFPNSSTWEPSLGYPEPSYVQDGFPTVQFLTNVIGSGAAALVSIEYIGGGGHELLINGISWDPTTNTGTLYFVDPLDPSQNYSGKDPLGPVKQTMGTIALDNDGKIVLTYDQYTGRLPYTGNYAETKAKLFGALSVGGAFYAPYASLTGNARAIADGFAQVDPTTAPINPVLAVLNTTADLQSAFDQLDPSVYNALVFTGHNVSQLFQNVLANNLLQYRSACDNSFDVSCPRIWATPFNQTLHQRSIGCASYKNSMNGGVIGIDCPLQCDLLLGAAFTYANSRHHWESISGKSNLNSYGLSIYGAYLASGLSVTANLEGFYNHAKGARSIYIQSALPFIAPIAESVDHKCNSYLYAGHLGISYDLWEKSFCNVQANAWPFLNLDCSYVRQSAFKERNGGVLDLNINRKGSHLIRSEIGMGCSLYFEGNIFLHTLLSYANESFFSGKKTHAYFTGTPASEFTICGQIPHNNVVCPSVILGTSTLCDRLKMNIAYRGEYGSDLTSNEFSAEFSIGF